MSLAKAVAGEVAAYTLPTHPLVRIAYEYRCTNTEFREDDRDVLEEEHDFRDVVIELLPLDHTFPADPWLNELWSKWRTWLREDRTPVFYPTQINIVVMRWCMSRGVLPALFVDQLHDADNRNGLNHTATPAILRRNPYVLRFHEDSENMQMQLDIYHMTRLG